MYLPKNTLEGRINFIFKQDELLRGTVANYKRGGYYTRRNRGQKESPGETLKASKRFRQEGFTLYDKRHVYFKNDWLYVVQYMNAV